MNANIDVSLASTSRESFARGQGPSHCTATLPVLDELRMNCAASYGYQIAAAKRLLNFRHSRKSTTPLNDETTISAEQGLKIQLRIPKKRRSRVRRNWHSPILEKHRRELILTWYLFQNPFCECTFSDTECEIQSHITP